MFFVFIKEEEFLLKCPLFSLTINHLVNYEYYLLLLPAKAELNTTTP